MIEFAYGVNDRDMVLKAQIEYSPDFKTHGRNRQEAEGELIRRGYRIITRREFRMFQSRKSKVLMKQG